ncbi:MAG: HD domain-containing protein, partial [Desulfobacteraceae bacterium]|nr:HD domain-containing protein [Desulfobacteraceae bacterium]
KNITPESIDAKRITIQAETIIEQLRLGNEKLPELALTQESKDENYLYCHSVNVCIYSIVMGLGLGYDKLKLTELGISALLHDIGMTEYLHLANHSRKLTSGEFKEIKKHPLKGTEILESVKNLKKAALYAVHQGHERENGTGYPRGLKKDSINEYAGIISIVDTFEAMTHPRAHRNEFLPIEALQKILNDKKAFKRKLIKMLIERIGIFPIGSFVELNTREVCRVIKLNHEVPLRPVVKIIYDAAGEEPEQAKIIDLTAQPNVFIKKGVRKNELNASPH